MKISILWKTISEGFSWSGRKMVLSIFLLLILLFSATVAYAAVNAELYVGDDSGVASFANGVNTYSVEKYGFNLFGYSSGVLSFNNTQYAKLTPSEKKDLLELALGSVNSSGIAKSNKIKVYNFIADQDGATAAIVKELENDLRGDFYEGYAIFKKWTPYINVALGILLWILMLTMSFKIIFDTAFLSELPIFNAVNTVATEGISRIRNKKTDGNTKPLLVSKTAFNIYNDDSISSSGGRLAQYFVSSFFTLLIFSLILILILTGKIWNVLLIFGNMLAAFGV